MLGCICIEVILLQILQHVVLAIQNPLLAKIFVLRGNTACAAKFLEPSFFHECPPYLPICGIYLLFQVNLHVPNSKPSNNNLFCMPESLMQRLAAVSIFHARWVILTMSGLRSSFTRKMAGNWDAQSHDQKIKIKPKMIANKTPPGLMLVGGTHCFEQAMD